VDEAASTLPRIRERPEDFLVEEIPLYEPRGTGQHTFVLVEKRLVNTEEVARQLARLAGVKPAQVGYAGRKDRRAVARQWFSVPGLEPQQATELSLDRARVVTAALHPHKLRTGHLRGNRFEIAVRRIDVDLATSAAEKLSDLARRGLPNRFGRQRFGRDGDNAARGAEVLRGGGRRLGRRSARFYLSALQAAVFNDVLARRPAPLDRLLLGDVAMVHASGGLFEVEDPQREMPRAERFEISPTGPIFGTKMKSPAGEVLALEQRILSAWSIPPLDELRSPRGIRLAGGRRPLRVPLAEARCRLDAGVLHLGFVLPPGSYATVLLEELFPDGFEEGAPGSVGR
jgi:tRNA pseudouridine13 synthase